MPFARLQDALRLLLKEELKAFKIISSQQSLLSPLANSDSAKEVLQDSPVSSKSFFHKSENLSKLSDCSWLYYVLVEKCWHLQLGRFSQRRKVAGRRYLETAEVPVGNAPPKKGYLHMRSVRL